MFMRSGLIAILISAGLVFSTTGHTAASDEYTSLQDFCLKTKADTPENCVCGQATADELLSKEEQTMALNMMGQRTQPSLPSAEAQDEFMAKLKRVTDGCAENDG